MNTNLINERINYAIECAKAFHEHYFNVYGQLILKLDEDTFLSSRPNMRLTKLTPGDFSICDIYSGDPGRILRSKRGINAIVILSTEASILFSDKKDLMIPALDDLAINIGPDVKVAVNGSAANILAALNDRNGCFVKGAGIVAIGDTLENAIARARIIEKSAEVEMFGDALGGIKYLPATDIQSDANFGNKYIRVNSGSNKVFTISGSSAFRYILQLIESGEALKVNDLVQANGGNLSVRFDETYMLITPSAMDYHKIKAEDIVQVNYHTLEYDSVREPSSESDLHAAIYRNFPDCKAIIHTHSTALSIFAAAHAGFKMDIPELKDVVGDLHISDYAPHNSEEFIDSIIRALQGTHSCIIANHGAIFMCDNLDLGIAIASAIEARAGNLIGIGSTIGDDEE